MKHKKVLITMILLVVLLCIFEFYTYISFNCKGLDQGLVGQAAEDEYPAWDNWNGSRKVSELEREIVNKSGLSLSKVYLIERANHYQIRFRIGCRIPFIHPELLNDIWWIVEDSAGKSYTSNMVVYAEQIAGLNCVNVTLVLDGEEFLNLAEKELNITAICSKEGYAQADIENSYAHCEVKLRCNAIKEKLKIMTNMDICSVLTGAERKQKNALAIDEPLEYARFYLEGNMQMWVNAKDSLELW